MHLCVYIYIYIYIYIHTHASYIYIYICIYVPKGFFGTAPLAEDCLLVTGLGPALP